MELVHCQYNQINLMKFIQNHVEHCSKRNNEIFETIKISLN